MANLPWIDEAQLARDEPRLFHYTNASSLSKILQSKAMFATHFEETNDRQEARIVREPLARRMATDARTTLLATANARGGILTRPEAEIEQDLLERARRFFDALLESYPTPLHITCFSVHAARHQENGLLTMWRLYGSLEKDKRKWRKRNEGQGVALAFNTEKLRLETEKILKTKGVSHIHLDRVYYGQDHDEIQRRIDAAPSISDQFTQFVMNLELGEEYNPQIDLDTLVKFPVLVVCGKHSDFEDEREVRLVVVPELEQSLNGRAPLVGPSRRLLVGYLDALEEVIVGPSKRQARLERLVRKILRQNGFDHVAVRKSGTPFRFL